VAGHAQDDRAVAVEDAEIAVRPRVALLKLLGEQIDVDAEDDDAGAVPSVV